MADVGLGVEEEPVTTKTVPVAQAKQEPIPKRPITPIPKARRALPDRMLLNTTTLPLEGGYWSPAFTKDAESQWTEILINQDLENKKWVSGDQVTTLSDLTPDQARPKTARSSPTKSDDDLFSELEELDQQKSRQMNNRPETSNRQNAAPAAQPFQNIPKPAQISSDQATLEAKNWKEPSPEENVSSDDWVKPSEFLKQKQSPKDEALNSIPSPRRIDKPASSPPPQSSGPHSIPHPKTAETIPQPKKMKVDANKGESMSKTSPQAQIVNEIRSWEEPKPEDNVSEDDWVRPSEFLQEPDKKESQPTNDSGIPKPPPPSGGVKKKVSRPPPKAPDAKKKSDEEDKEQGWASWDD
jgi:hypothetical protein